MRKLAAVVQLSALAICFVSSGCGSPDASPSPSPSPAPPSNVPDVTGRQRLAWSQPAPDRATLAQIRYAAYVDGDRSELTDLSCADVAEASGFPCTSRLPVMSRGLHTIEATAFIVNGDSFVESDHSDPLKVNVLTAITQSVSGSAALLDGGTLTTVGPQPFRAELVTDGLEDPTDMVVAPDGRIFVTERAGRVRVVQQDRLRLEPSLRLDDVAAAGGGGLVALAIDPQFSSNHFIYTIYTVRSRGDALVFRLARFREVLGTLGERAILLEGVPAGEEAGANLSFGRDGKLYAAFDDSGDARLREKLSSYNGKVLRLNPDASTPGDNASASPIYASGFRSPHGLDWQPATGMLWLVDRAPDGAAALHAIGFGGGRSIVGTVRRSYLLPSPTDTTAILFYHGGLLPTFEGNLLIANERGHYILRARLDGNVPPNIVATEALLQDRVGAVRALAIGLRGEIYFTTDNTLGRIVAQ